MRLDLGGYKLTDLTKLDSSSGILGLDEFLKSLERDYYSNIHIRKYSSVENSTNMALDIICPVSLLEILGHYNKGRWGQDSKGNSVLQESFKTLCQQNSSNSFDIEELTLFFKDTSIVVKRLYDRSIPEQLDNIITEIARHYVFFTKGLTERPYEIFVPVFEDTLHSESHKKPITQLSPQTYFEYWGVYLDSEDEALIYDLRKNSFIPADLDLYMLED
ncbi:hypothetical protein [Maribacter aestuarii]|uniref:hypothetical protein n=1 Tax=Maribacter aestuarii TaxID=1130723 RepID=UPI00248C19A2|nr:hypothetical protein [Maribacter aestuarii]